MMRYAIVIEKTKSNYSAYVPDLPGCVATAGTKATVRKRIAEAIDLHIQGMKEDGLRIPRPAAAAEYIEIAA